MADQRQLGLNSPALLELPFCGAKQSVPQYQTWAKSAPGSLHRRSRGAMWSDRGLHAATLAPGCRGHDTVSESITVAQDTTTGASFPFLTKPSSSEHSEG